MEKFDQIWVTSYEMQIFVLKIIKNAFLIIKMNPFVTNI